ncbi:fimbrial biogenesis chaperone, partial [Klebsiella pneumoniae]|uniref:fimbrial biogenesis chaperone n=1 Tax=Klebsiella pneumoniae TaxID=573 RepID=UPI004049DDEA
KGWDARKRAYCLKIQPATGSFARNLIYSTKPRISRDGGKALNSKTVMLAPQSSQTVALSSAVNRGETLTVNNINDYGADVAVKVAVK